MSVSWSRKYYRRMVNLKTPSVLFHTLALSNSTFISLKVACIISFPSCKHSIRQPPLVMSDNLTTKIFRLRTYTSMHALYTIRPTLPKTHIPRASSTPLERPQLLVPALPPGELLIQVLVRHRPRLVDDHLRLHRGGGTRPRNDENGSGGGRGRGGRRNGDSFVDRLNPNLRARLEAMLPSGMSLEEAAEGFRNQGQFIAALQQSQNHDISFADLKAEMTAAARRQSDPVAAVEAIRGIRRRELFRVAAGDLLGRPAPAKTFQHRTAQAGLPFEARARPAPRSHLLLGIAGLVADLNARITVQLPRDR